MAGEIDKLEIQISADANSASENISALAGSLEKLSAALSGVSGTSASMESLANSLNSLKFIKISKGLESELGNLKSLFATFSDIKSSDSLTNYADTISSAVSTLGMMDVDSAVSNLARIAPVIQDVTNAMIGLQSASVQFEQIAESIASFSYGVNSLSYIDTENIENIVNAFQRFNEMHLDDNISGQLRAIASSVNALSNAEWNESAADNLQFFIDTSRDINDSDIEHLNALAEAANSLQVTNINLPDGPAISPLPDDLIESMREYFNAANEDEEEEEELEQSTSRLTSVFHALRDAIRGAVSVAAKFTFKTAVASVKAIMSPITSLRRKFADAAKKAKEFLSSIKRIAMYRVIRSALKAITDGFQEGRENLYQYSVLINGQFAKSMDMAATSFLYLKNSIGAATAPLTNVLVPILDQVVDKAVDVINVFNEMTAVLTGSDTWTKAIKYPVQWQEAADDANKSAKKLKSTILGFDELNVIEPTRSGSGSADDFGLDYSRMFVEVETSANWDNVTDEMPDILLPIKLAWDTEGQNTLDTISETWESILRFVDSVNESFVTIWENETGQTTLELLLSTLQNIVGTIGAIADGWKKAWSSGAGLRILQSFWNIANNILTVFDEIWDSIRQWTENLDWQPLFDSLAILTKSIEKLTDPESGAMQLLKKLWTEVLEPLGKWTTEDGLPAAIDLVSEAVNTLNIALDNANNSKAFNAIIDFLKSVAGFTFENISGLAAALTVIMSFFGNEEVSDSTANRLERTNEKFSGNWFNDAMLSTGEWLYDKSNKYQLDNEGLLLSGAEKGTGQKWGELLGGGVGLSVGGLFGAGIGKKAGGITGNFIEETIIPGLEKAGEALYDFKELLVSGFWESIAKIAEFIDMVGEGWGIIADGFSSVQEMISAIADILGTTFLIGLDMAKEKVIEWKDDFVEKFTDAKEWAVEKWSNIKTDLKNGWVAIKGKVTDWKEHWDDKISVWKKDVSDKWNDVKIDLKTGWYSVKEKVSDWKDDWGDKLSSWKQDATDKWEEIKKDFKDGTAWDSISEKVSDWRDDWGEKLSGWKKDASDKWEEVKKDLKDSEAWQSISDKVMEWKDNFSDAFSTLTLKAANFRTNVCKIFKQIWEGSSGTGGIKGVTNNILGGVESLINFMISGINKFIELLNNIRYKTPDWLKMISDSLGKSLPDELGFNINTLANVSIPRLARGGVISDGQLFLANENGAELVGQFGNKTAVVNNGQIIQAISDAVYKAFIAANSVSNNDSGNSSNEFRFYLDGREINARIEEIQREKGAPILSGAVYG